MVQPYDPVAKSKANREYYLRTRQLKGREPSLAPKRPPKRPPIDKGGETPTPPTPAEQQAARERVKRLTAKIETLNGALTKASAALVEARAKERKAARESSDGKSTAKEKRASQEYRDKNKEKLKAEAKKEAEKEKTSSSSSGGSSSSSSSSSKSLSERSPQEIYDRIVKIKSALADARRQLARAKQVLGQIAHSAIVSDPQANELFARFRLEERIPSK